MNINLHAHTKQIPSHNSALARHEFQRPTLDPHLLSKDQHQHDDQECSRTDPCLCAKADFCTRGIRPGDLEVGDYKTAGLDHISLDVEK